MPPFWIAGTAMHATAILVAAFFVFFSAVKAGPVLRVSGVVLGGWLIVLAVGGATFELLGGPPPPPPGHPLPMVAPQPFVK